MRLNQAHFFVLLSMCEAVGAFAGNAIYNWAFSTVFEPNVKSEAKTPIQKCYYIYDRVMASASNCYHSFLYVSKYLLIRKTQQQKKIKR